MVMARFRIMKKKIYLKGLRFFGYHGVYPEEALTGHWFELDLTVAMPKDAGMDSDDLAHTLDYELLYNICHRVMGERTSLLETLGQRIIAEIRRSAPQSGKIKLHIAKMNPLFSGQCRSVAIGFESKKMKD
jgi:7,8-dihydroneopterin aldolase/epimerase/oxygenase